MPLPAGYSLESAPSAGGLPPGYALEGATAPTQRNWSDVPGEALSNVADSGAKMLSGVGTAIAHPFQTIKGVLDIGAGAVQNAMPKAVLDFVAQFDANPDAAKHAVEVANAVGGIYKDRYGTVEGLKKTLATDPVGAAADFSTLLSGGAALAGKVGAVRAATVLDKAATLTNPLTAAQAVVNPLAKAGAKAAGWTTDLVTGQLPAVKAGKIARDAAGADLPAIQAANAAAPADITAAQAAVGVGNPVWSALGAKAAEYTPTPYDRLAKTQEAARQAAIANVTPDLAAAQGARVGASQPLYAAADRATVTLDPAMMNIFDRMPNGVLGRAADIARMEGRPFQMGEFVPPQQVSTGVLNAAGQPITTTLPAQFPTITGESLHYVKRALSDIANAPASVQGIGRDAQAAARGVLGDFVSAFEGAVPEYGAARQAFAAASQPVNQAQVLNELSSVLQKPGGGERASAFQNVLGRGEQAMLKRSTGFPRYETGDLGNVLSQPQMATVTDVSNQLARDTEVARQARAGQGALTNILRQDTSPLQLPGFLNYAATAANAVLRALHGKVSDKTVQIISEGMANGASANELLAKLPAVERNTILKYLANNPQMLSNPALLGAGQVQNALAPQRNAMGATQ